MYLSEEKRAAIRECFKHQSIKSNTESNQQENCYNNTNESEEIVNQVSRILFDARDGKEVFTPF